MASKIRSKIIIWHRWFGVFAALWLALMGITGSLIVFYGEINDELNADLQITTNVGIMLPLEEILKTAENAQPEGLANFINVPNHLGETAQVSFSFPGTTKSPMDVFVDPYTGELLGELGPPGFNRRSIMKILYQLHMDLLLGDVMFIFLGLIALLWFIDHFVVLWISFPALKKWTQSFLIRPNISGIKFHYDLHRALGLWLFPVTFVLALSGLFFNLNYGFEPVVNFFSPLKPRHIFIMEKHSEPLYSPQVKIDKAAMVAQQRAGKEVDIISYYPYLQAYLARTFDERDIDPHGRRLITVDANSGNILDDSHAASGSAGDVFLMWQYPLHSGKAFGWTGRIIIFLSGITLTIVCVTGLVIWWRKLRARKKG